MTVAKNLHWRKIPKPYNFNPFSIKPIFGEKFLKNFYSYFSFYAREKSFE